MIYGAMDAEDLRLIYRADLLTQLSSRLVAQSRAILADTRKSLEAAAKEIGLAERSPLWFYDLLEQTEGTVISVKTRISIPVVHRAE
jgi:hypothetical protein